MNRTALVLGIAIVAAAVVAWFVAGRLSSHEGPNENATKSQDNGGDQPRPFGPLPSTGSNETEDPSRNASTNQGGSADSPGLLARVGELLLTADRLRLWMKIEQLRSGEPSEESDVFVNLLEQMIKQQVARRAFGLFPRQEDLESRAKEWEAIPENRETLEKIQALFGGDRRKFLQEFVLPAVIESRLWNRFRGDGVVHEESYGAARQALQEALAEPQRFLELAPKGGKFGRHLVSLGSKGAEAFPDDHPFSPLRNVPVDQGTLDRLQEGELYPTIIDTPGAIRVLKMVYRREGYAEVEVWTIRKRDYYDWLGEQGAALGPIITEPAASSHLDNLDDSHWLHRAFP